MGSCSFCPNFVENSINEILTIFKLIEINSNHPHTPTPPPHTNHPTPPNHPPPLNHWQHSHCPMKCEKVGAKLPTVKNWMGDGAGSRPSYLPSPTHLNVTMNSRYTCYFKMPTVVFRRLLQSSKQKKLVWLTLVI